MLVKIILNFTRYIILVFVVSYILKHAARALAELIVYGRYTTINLDRFSFERFVRQELVYESEVV